MVENAKNARSSCKKCKQKIDKETVIENMNAKLWQNE